MNIMSCQLAQHYSRRLECGASRKCGRALSENLATVNSPSPLWVGFVNAPDLTPPDKGV